MVNTGTTPDARFQLHDYLFLNPILSHSHRQLRHVTSDQHHQQARISGASENCDIASDLKYVDAFSKAHDITKCEDSDGEELSV